MKWFKSLVSLILEISGGIYQLYIYTLEEMSEKILYTREEMSEKSLLS